MTEAVSAEAHARDLALPKQPTATRRSGAFSGWLPILVVFTIGFGYPLVPMWALYSPLRDLGLNDSQVGGIVTILREVVVLAVIARVIMRWEGLPLSSAGVGRPAISDLFWGGLVFVMVCAVNEYLGPYIRGLLPASADAEIARGGEYLNQVPHLLLYLGMVTGVTLEELVARGYAIERLSGATGSIQLAAAGALILDAASHIPFWGVWYPFVIAPSQFIFILLYIDRRTIWASALAHLLMNILPLPTQYLPPNLVRALAPYTAGFNYYQEHDYEHAIVAFDTALRRNPNDAKAYDARGFAYWQKQELERAIADFSAEVLLRPDSSDGFANRARVYLAKGNYASAREDIDRAIRLKPASKYLYSLRVIVDCSQQKYDLVLKDLAEGARLDPGDAGIRAQRGEMMVAAGDYRSALTELDAAVMLKPDDAKLRRMRATTALALGDCTKARDDFAKLVVIAPADSAVAGTAAWLGASCLSTTDANKALERARDTFKVSTWKDPLAIEVIAHAYAMSGDFKQAIKWQLTAIALMSSGSASAAQTARETLNLYRDHQYWRVNREDFAQIGQRLVPALSPSAACN